MVFIFIFIWAFSGPRLGFVYILSPGLPAIVLRST